ncbi:MAG: response regulator [Halobacteriovoraceae bacterium]|nr:response regulator [Halobacteriovoraceae bacterium]
MKTGELNFSNKTFAELMGQEDDSTTAQKSPDAPVKGRPTLVLVDDEVEILDGLSTILRDESYNVVTFNQASTFIEKLSSMEIDLLLTDFKMPGINGLELVQIVHKAKPQLPIVMISGFLDPNIIIEGLSVGISGFIQKPIKFNYLLPMISNFIKKYRSYTLLEESVKALLFQYTDLDNYLKDNGEDDIRNSLKQKIVKIIEHQKNLAL